MPYLKESERDCQRDGGKSLRALGKQVGKAINSGGDLQYVLAEAIQAYLEKTGLRYVHCETVMGALQGAQSEFYRVVVGPYEQQKIVENGSVYDINKMIRKGY